MKRFFPVYIRVPLLFFACYGILDYFIDSGDKPMIIQYPSVLALLGLILLVLIAIEIVANASNNIINQLMSPEERAQKEALDNLPLSELPFVKNLLKKLTKSRSIDEEKDIELEHDYDGIKELDNDLPPWWVYLFYGTIIFGVIYLGKYELFGGENQIQELEKDMAIAQKEIEEYKKTAPDMLTADKVVLLTDAGDIAAGKAIYDTNCVACHRADGGGGIGPNLTDDSWILGGDVKEIFNTIMEGGRDGKGMVAWKQQIKPSDIQKVASYILTLQGTNPPDGKAPEGDKVAGASAAATPANGATKDTLANTATPAPSAP
ncbi:cbb3-type cytochrome c oxidase N-terminal domain-containing protein [Myroides sp. JBRI-B21084]|uniref:cbb3-type cytochrome c oxidase N-terminal domain-containing protein n=1 Tax=Myroides sp. JBRI-B21084 TaxID=3119977 RepID=UPI0026E43526|nr:cbb3-type cytochrome c oxidase N-terminal domain-containing protein [Paenimyroides cloacae]WKW46653.1 cbb3-type cytochrome c oxidase N-terminal domain-containing protein [Paenimyroides cloacae]